LAEIRYLLRQFDEAKELYQEIRDTIEEQITQEKVNPDYDLLGWCYYRLGKYGRAAKCFITALSQADEHDPNKLSSQFDLALVFLCSDRYMLALQQYETAVQFVSSQCSLRRRGLLYVALVDLQDALENCPKLQKVKEAKQIEAMLSQALDEVKEAAKLAIQPYL
jgi:tetratricopeptide (TPR) repeat protein